jgi:hypothetical protein
MSNLCKGIWGCPQRIHTFQNYWVSDIGLLLSRRRHFIDTKVHSSLHEVCLYQYCSQQMQTLTVTEISMPNMRIFATDKCLAASSLERTVCQSAHQAPCWRLLDMAMKTSSFDTIDLPPFDWTWNTKFKSKSVTGSTKLSASWRANSCWSSQ